MMCVKSKHTLMQNTLLKLAIVFKEHAHAQYIIIFAMEIKHLCHKSSWPLWASI